MKKQIPLFIGVNGALQSFSFIFNTYNIVVSIKKERKNNKMVQVHELIKKVKTNNLKIKNNETRLKDELELIKETGKDRKKFDKMVKESKGAIANIRFSMTYIQASKQMNPEDYLQIMNDLTIDENKLNQICEELDTYLKGDQNNA